MYVRDFLYFLAVYEDHMWVPVCVCLYESEWERERRGWNVFCLMFMAYSIKQFPIAKVLKDAVIHQEEPGATSIRDHWTTPLGQTISLQLICQHTNSQVLEQV